MIRRLACILAAAVLGGCSTPVPTSPPGNHVLELPASFTGTLPCQDCNGVRAHLDLWPDGVFHLSRTHDGEPAGQGDRYDLAGTGQLQPADLSRGLHGMFRYLADAATFEECLTGRPRLEGTGTVPTVVVRRFVGLWPSQSCERAMSHASLVPQYWRIVSLRGAPVSPVGNTREPHLILRDEASGYVATAGCDRFRGNYRVAGTQIAFDAPDAPVPCPAELQQRQATLLEVLMATRSWSIQGQGLELFDASGRSIAVLEAVYLR